VSPFLSSGSVLRRILASNSAVEVLDIVGQHTAAPGSDALSEADCIAIITASLEKGKADLALSIYCEMCVTKREKTLRGLAGALYWPAATLSTTSALVLGLCQQLRTAEALQVVADLRVQGLPRAEDTSFGTVVPSPLPPGRPLAVVQPQEGNKVVADADSRYEFELFSGSVTSCSSEALEVSSNLLLDLARAAGLWRRLPVAAVHEFVVQAPDSASRTFRCGTATPDVPAQMGQRVTVVCSPVRSSRARQRLLSPSPPGTTPGQALSVVSHKTGAALPLLRPPASLTQVASPSWLLPAVALLAGSDAATALIDPNLPLLVAAGAAAVAGSAVAGSTLLIPRLKQLPERSVKLEAMRQALLVRYTALLAKSKAALAQTSEELRTLARLWQLQVGSQGRREAGWGGGGGRQRGSWACPHAVRPTCPACIPTAGARPLAAHAQRLAPGSRGAIASRHAACAGQDGGGRGGRLRRAHRHRVAHAWRAGGAAARAAGAPGGLRARHEHDRDRGARRPLLLGLLGPGEAGRRGGAFSGSGCFSGSGWGGSRWLLWLAAALSPAHRLGGRQPCRPKPGPGRGTMAQLGGLPAPPRPLQSARQRPAPEPSRAELRRACARRRWRWTRSCRRPSCWAWRSRWRGCRSWRS
jgi:hypothetical protein